MDRGGDFGDHHRRGAPFPVFPFRFVDDRLEGLNKAQKHFVRMGPRNILIVQDQLRQIATALGVPRERLPKSVHMLPRAGRP